MVNKLLISLLTGLRPLLGPASCHFEPTCGNFAVEQLQKNRLFPALITIIQRLISCRP